ncbi:MAG: GNAT family N-acetyltransferase [Aestuariivirgaceae bacterium]|nr:GNAT family N-acetyltransferase [Aestuariivirgaceae bacterium]
MASSANGIPIRKLWAGDLEDFRAHLLRLDETTRRQRFGGAVSDEFLGHYAQTAFRIESVIYGAFVNGTLRACAELRNLSEIWSPEAEAAFSVEPEWQDDGLGTRLMERILNVAQNRSIRKLYMVCLSENQRMRHLAEKYEARLILDHGELAGTLNPGFPTPSSMLEEWMDDGRGFATAMFSWGR